MPPETDFSLRPARAADFAAIKSLIHAVQINPIGLDWHRFILAVDPQDQMIGCGQIKPHRDGSRELGSVAVRPEWRSRGVAARIIQYLITENPGSLYLTCRGQLGSFYERFGFRRIFPDEMPPYFKRIYRLVESLKKLGALGDEEMWVMVRE